MVWFWVSILAMSSSSFVLLDGFDPFFGFRIMVGSWLLLLGVAWAGSYLVVKRRIENNRPLLWMTFLGFPVAFVAIVTRWLTAEVGRQPWAVYHVLKTADAMTPFPAHAATVSLLVYGVAFLVIAVFRAVHVHRLPRALLPRSLTAAPAIRVSNEDLLEVN